MKKTKIITIIYEYDEAEPGIGKKYDPCFACSNNPRNGGSGVCFCTLPAFWNPVTTSTGGTFGVDPQVPGSPV